MRYKEKSQRNIIEDRKIDYFKKLMLKEAIGGTFSDVEINDITELDVLDYDAIKDELCSEETSFLDLYTLLRELLNNEFDNLFRIPKEDPRYSYEKMLEEHVIYSKMIDRANIMLLNHTDKKLEIDDLVGSYDLRGVRQRKLVPVLLRSPFLEDRSGILN